MDTNEKTMTENKTEDPNPKSSNAKSFKTYFIICFILLFGLAIFFIYNHLSMTEEISQLSGQKQDLFFKLHNRDSVINNYVGALNDIEANIETLKQKENILYIESKEQSFTNDQKEKIIEDIKLLNTILINNKKQIEQLNKKLANSGIQIKQLEDRIKNLTTILAERDTSISLLKKQLSDKNFEISQLNATMDNMGKAIQEKNNTIANQDSMINRVYFISGTYKELKQKGIITKTGGFFWIGKKTEFANNFADSLFQHMDMRQTKSFPVNAKSAKFITDHPADSYQIIKNNDKVESIQIKNPQKFWKYSKYAILEIK